MWVPCITPGAQGRCTRISCRRWSGPCDSRFHGFLEGSALSEDDAHAPKIDTNTVGQLFLQDRPPRPDGSWCLAETQGESPRLKDELTKVGTLSPADTPGTWTDSRRLSSPTVPQPDAGRPPPYLPPGVRAPPVPWVWT